MFYTMFWIGVFRSLPFTLFVVRVVLAVQLNQRFLLKQSAPTFFF